MQNDYEGEPTAGAVKIPVRDEEVKGYVKHNLNSSKMRKGGLNKLSEIIVMAAACGLDIGINALGAYYQAVELSAIVGKITAVAVFIYHGHGGSIDF